MLNRTKESTTPLSIKKRAPKANILIIVVLLLFISGLYGALMTKYVGSLIQYTREITHYHKAYYLAYAGIELGLTKIENRHFGFEDMVQLDSQTNDNRENNGKFTYTMESSHDVLAALTGATFDASACDLGGGSPRFKLDSGEGVIIPLTRDSIALGNIETNTFVPSETDVSNIGKIMIETSDDATVSLPQDPSTLTLTDFSLFETKKSLNGGEEINSLFDNSTIGGAKYLIVVSEADNNQICIEHTNGGDQDVFPTQSTLIKSDGVFGRKVVSLEIDKPTGLPERLIFTALG